MDKRDFFRNSDLLDYMVLRPLAHIRSGWELVWEPESNAYEEEEDSFAGLLNGLISQLATVQSPPRYHDSEDRLAEYVQRNLNWGIRKEGRRWVGADYDVILQQGSFGDADQSELLLASAGRIQAAITKGQLHFDDMEESHQRMLGAVLSIILWQRDAWK
ncbi:hypothetical protein [Paludibaculum fermentans]|uniref:hypothetical protein n=1 Tax=Paludibaculum fermentans TaxID=1473598 RepID=UPI003EC10A80